VITLDAVMPGKDGWQVLAELKADPQLADIPVVLLTIQDNKQKGFALGASDYLTKPMQADRLRDVIRRLLPEAGGLILIVDDDGETRRRERRALENAGWQVMEAENGRVALERIRQQRPDTILLDLLMPEMDGFEFLDQLCRDADLKSIPVVVLTAKDLSAEERRALKASASRILEKGRCGTDELVHTVSGMVGRYVGSSSRT
jgi:CheY-like chemotaxis protein